MKPPITLFEYERREISDLQLNESTLQGIERINEACGAEMVRVGRTQIQATHFVGVWRVGDITFQILPKIDYPMATQSGIPPQNASIYSATQNLLHLLAYTQDLKLYVQDTASLAHQPSDWFELLTRLFVLNMQRLFKQGVEHTYVPFADSLPVIRGKWQLSQQLARHAHRPILFDVEFDEFVTDTPLNRIFCHVVDRLLHVTGDPFNHRLLADMHVWLADVRSLPSITRQQLDQISFTRLNERFRPAFNLARLFIENDALQLTSGLRQTFAFAFDMNALFEQFVGRFLKVHRLEILPADWGRANVILQSAGLSFYLAEQGQPRKPAFQLVPDILITDVNQPRLVIDTKYKALNPTQPQLGVSEGDIYQMLAYATRLACQNVLLLYPQLTGLGHIASYQFQSYPGTVHLATINLHQPLNTPNALIHELRTLVDVIAKEDLAYGSPT